MIAKILIFSGAIIILASVLGIVSAIITAFKSMSVSSSGSAGIGAIGGGLLFALASNILVFVGLAILAIGLVKFFREKNPRK